MVAIGVNDDGYREVIGAAEGFTCQCWREFLSGSGPGLSGVRMFTGDKAAAMTGAIAEVFPDAAYQRCTVHFYRNVLSESPSPSAPRWPRCSSPCPESLEASTEKAGRVAAKLEDMRLAAAAQCVRDGVAETLTYTRFPARHWRRIRTNNAIERLNREIRRRTRVVGTFPDGKRAHAGDRAPEVRGRQRVGVEEVSGRVAAGRVIMPTAGGRLLEFAQDY